MTEQTRRDFLKSSTLAAAGTGLLTQIASRAYAQGDDVLRIGVVGCGGRGRGAAAQALLTNGNVKLVAVGDAFEDELSRGLKFIEKAVEQDDTAEVAVDEDHRFVGFDAYQKVIDSDVDVVILATPPGFRPIHFAYAVERGRHVFMEKPVAVDAPGVRSVLESARLAKQKNLKIGVGLQRRHQDFYLDLVRRIQDGEIGQIRALRVYWNGAGVWEPRVTRDQVKTEMEYQMRNWYYYNWLCGDHICEQHIHNMDVGNWIMNGYPVKASGMGGRQVRVDPKYGEIYDHHAVQFTYADGTVMFSECRHIPNCMNRISEHAHGTLGTADLSWVPRMNRLSKFDGTVYECNDASTDPYQQEHDDLFAAIRADLPYDETEVGAMSTMTSILGRMCSYSGKEILFDDALAKGLNIMPTEFAWDAAPPTVPGPEGRYPIPTPGITKVMA